MYFPKSSASCRSRASAPSTGTATARGSWLVSWSYPCSPPLRWNPEGSSPWCHRAPLGASEEAVGVVVAGCGHPGTSVRTELQHTASAPAAALMKPFRSLSSYPSVRCPSSRRSVFVRETRCYWGSSRRRRELLSSKTRVRCQIRAFNVSLKGRSSEINHSLIWIYFKRAVCL